MSPHLPNILRRHVVVAPLMLLLAACAGVPGRSPAPVPAPTVEAPVSVPPAPSAPSAPPVATPVPVTPPPAAGVPAVPAPAAAPYAGAAVTALLAQARSEAAAGEADRAAATLERALRIEPSNPWLWHRLAVLRLQQGMWPQARTLAERSNALAAGNSRLLGGNWRVIGEALRGAGDTAGAAAALEQSERHFRTAPAP